MALAVMVSSLRKYMISHVDEVHICQPSYPTIWLRRVGMVCALSVAAPMEWPGILQYGQDVIVGSL